jgi:hypothetical protein
MCLTTRADGYVNIRNIENSIEFENWPTKAVKKFHERTASLTQ